ncbi:iron uptake system EfeUOB component EfeO/EfeM [Salirhabdus euzebyi]|uniref:Iron uptake system EfeUOB component EfeO/EfeM n=1 Tax=Salirhabdus euzebyi TaxID=394506 RepID=A0A841Q5U7_9BACI|nr:hypothetical protein [Salirhabdus euzebyi]MBB6453692.1 iron uptake system EfeUOB component EfeO/EfeM [Salirhabdus euzebyi]
MKKLLLTIGTLLTVSVLLLGFNTVQNEGGTDLVKGIDKVLETNEKLKKAADKSPENTAKINKLGKELGENWDVIEKQVEEKYPKDYINIEKSLYPLIAYAKKDKPDVKKIVILADEVNEKLVNFKERVK